MEIVAQGNTAQQQPVINGYILPRLRAAQPDPMVRAQAPRSARGLRIGWVSWPPLVWRRGWWRESIAAPLFFDTDFGFPFLREEVSREGVKEAKGGVRVSMATKPRPVFGVKRHIGKAESDDAVLFGRTGIPEDCELVRGLRPNKPDPFASFAPSRDTNS